MNCIFPFIELKVLNSCWFEENKESGSYLGASNWSETESECRSFHQTRKKWRSALSSICFEPKNMDLYLIVQDQVPLSFSGWPKPVPQDNVLTMVVSDTWVAHSQSLPVKRLQAKILSKRSACVHQCLTLISGDSRFHEMFFWLDN